MDFRPTQRTCPIRLRTKACIPKWRTSLKIASQGQDLFRETAREALAIRSEEWKAELDSAGEFSEKISQTMPKELKERRSYPRILRFLLSLSGLVPLYASKLMRRSSRRGILRQPAKLLSESGRERFAAIDKPQGQEHKKCNQGDRGPCDD
jgi:hypothetical protein